jgi:hypothetical protein
VTERSRSDTGITGPAGMSRSIGVGLLVPADATRDNPGVTPEQVVRAIYDAWLERRPCAGSIAEDVEYVNPPDAVEPGVKQGRKYFRGIRDVYDEVTITPSRVEVLGD